MSTGVGILFNGTLDDFFAEHADAVDYVSVIPDRFWSDGGRAQRPRFRPLPDEVAILDRLASRYPLVAHGVGLSIASASTFDVDHLQQLAQWQRRYRFGWVSEHLAAVRVLTEVTPDHHAGLALPLPWDVEVLDMLCERLAIAHDVLGSPMLLENGVVHTPVPDTDLSEAAFLNTLCARSGCRVLLDLHNLHVNAINLGIDTDRFIEELDLENVVEIHVAGGNRLYGVYLDSHAGPCPPEVWRLLATVAPRCPNLAGVTFEFHESYYPMLGVEGIYTQLERAREALGQAAQDTRTCRSANSSAHLPT